LYPRGTLGCTHPLTLTSIPRGFDAQVVTGRMPFLSPNQRCQSTEGMHIKNSNNICTTQCSNPCPKQSHQFYTLKANIFKMVHATTTSIVTSCLFVVHSNSDHLPFFCRRQKNCNCTLYGLTGIVADSVRWPCMEVVFFHIHKLTLLVL